jgi:hypothetical protein
VNGRAEAIVVVICGVVALAGAVVALIWGGP